MFKIPSLFKREFGPDIDCPATKEVKEGCEWVIDGLGLPSRKFDGTSVLVWGETIYRRKTLSPSDYKDGFPEKWHPAQSKPRSDNGKWPGWLVCDEDDPSDQYHFEAYHNDVSSGTYELIGPKIQGNPEGVQEHQLVPHGHEIIQGGEGPRSYDEIKKYLKNHEIEGIVWRYVDHHTGVYLHAKVKRSDFGLEWPV